MSMRDRTQLATLGFADPDKKNGLHDLACQFLYKPEVRLAVFKRVVSSTRPKVSLVDWARTEYPLSKGSGQYRTTIGFLDVLYVWYGFVTNWETESGHIVVEVKTTRPLSTGDVLRQIRLYQEYWPTEEAVKHVRGLEGAVNSPINCRYRPSFDRTYWVLATTFPVHSEDIAFLRSEGVFHVYLGDTFQTWLKLREMHAPQARVQCED